MIKLHKSKIIREGKNEVSRNLKGILMAEWDRPPNFASPALIIYYPHGHFNATVSVRPISNAAWFCPRAPYCAKSSPNNLS